MRIDQLGKELAELETRLREACESKIEVARQADAANGEGLSGALEAKEQEGPQHIPA